MFLQKLLQKLLQQVLTQIIVSYIEKAGRIVNKSRVFKNTVVFCQV